MRRKHSAPKAQHNTDPAAETQPPQNYEWNFGPAAQTQHLLPADEQAAEYGSEDEGDDEPPAVEGPTPLAERLNQVTWVDGEDPKVVVGDPVDFRVEVSQLKPRRVATFTDGDEPIVRVVLPEAASDDLIIEVAAAYSARLTVAHGDQELQLGYGRFGPRCVRLQRHRPA